jgi:calcineurin-like phosphoesterase family protein
MIYFTADLHFGHKNILKYEDRPYKDVDTMNEELIKNWNNTVTNDDEIYILGDLFFLNQEKSEEILKVLNGKKILIKGNHDKIHKPNEKYFTGIHDYLLKKFAGVYFVLFHYPIFDWDGKHRGSIHLHGHVHSRGDIFLPNKINVGVDVIGFKPISLEEVFSRCNRLNEYNKTKEKV